jgi:hypothetical protein
MTPPRGAGEILNERGKLDWVVSALAQRAADTEEDRQKSEDLRHRVRDRAVDLLEEWNKIAHEYQNVGAHLQYQIETGGTSRLLYEFLNPELKKLPQRHQKFRANRSMRDVEAGVNIWVKTLDNIDVEDDE